MLGIRSGASISAAQVEVQRACGQGRWRPGAYHGGVAHREGHRPAQGRPPAWREGTLPPQPLWCKLQYRSTSFGAFRCAAASASDPKQFCLPNLAGFRFETVQGPAASAALSAMRRRQGAGFRRPGGGGSAANRSSGQTHRCIHSDCLPVCWRHSSVITDFPVPLRVSAVLCLSA